MNSVNFHNRTRRGGREFTFLVAAIVGVLALVLSMLTIAPSATAQEATGTTATDTTTSVTPAPVTTSTEPTPDATTPSEPTTTESSVTSTTPAAEDTETNSPAPAEEPAPEPSTTAPADPVVAYDQDIDVTVTGISRADGDDEPVTVGDAVTITGDWDATGAEGTVFWVTFPPSVLGEFDIVEPTRGAKPLIDDGAVFGFEVDTAGLGETGEWEMEATAVAATDDDSLNFRTSASPNRDVAVDLPAGGGIAGVHGARAAAPAANGPSAGVSESGITVGEVVIDNPGNPGQQLQPGDSARISGTWSAPDDATGGETFTVQFPDVFEMLPTGTFELSPAYGTCEVNVENNTLECEIDDRIANEVDVEGTWELYVTADRRTTEENVPFLIDGGDSVVARLPGENGGIGRVVPLPTEPNKSGSRGNDQRTVTWTVDLPGTYLREHGVDNPATFVDTPSHGQTVVEGSGNVQFYEELSGGGSPADVRDLPEATLQFTEPNDEGSFNIILDPAEEWDPFKVYRITYQTWTDDLLPPTAQLTNNFGIGEGPGIGGGAGSPVWKTGEPADSTWQAINWTILAPATQAVDGVLTIQDSLESSELPHSALDPDTVESLTVGGATVDGDAALTVNDAEGKDITITIPVPQGVVDANGVYEVSYTTYYDGTEDYPLDSLPQGGQRFENTAKVGSEDVYGYVTTPDWNSAKSGSLNGQEVEFNGETYPVNTLLNWRIDVSGNQINDLDGPVTVTDTLDENHRVCEADGSAADRLGLNLTVLDRTNANAVVEDPGVELTASVNDENDAIEYELTSENGEFSRDHIYRIEYVTCTASGGQDPYGTEYSNTVEGSGVETSQSISLRAGSGGTGQGVARGSFSLFKGEAFGSEPIDPELEFTVLVEEFAPGVSPDEGAPEDEYEIQVKANGEPVSGWFTRGTGWTIRLTEVGFEDAPGLHFEAGQFRETDGVTVSEDGTEALVAVTPGSNVEVQLENFAREGTAEITKVVAGDAAEQAAGQEFTVTANVYPYGDMSQNPQRQTIQLRDGEGHNFGELPIGTVITFSEQLPESTDEITWGTPVFSPERLVVGSNDAANTVTVTNYANSTEGTFSVEKRVGGAERDNPAVPETFEVLATWGDDESTTLTVPTNGEAVTYDGAIPAGTEVTLTEALPAAGDGVSWSSPIFGGTGVRTVDGAAVFTVGLDPVQVTMRNVANEHVGDLRIDKTVVGDAAGQAAGANFALIAEIDHNGDGIKDEERQFTLQDDQYWLLADLPIGAEVTFSEELPADTDAVTWGEPVFEPSATVTVDDDSEATVVTLTNTANVTEGTFSLQKELTGPQQYSDDVPETFEVEATWIDAAGDEQTTTLALPADGTPVEFGEQLPAGTVVTLTETAPADGEGLAWAVPAFSGDVTATGENSAEVTIGLGSQDVTVTNYVDVNDGTLRVAKAVTGEAADQIGDDAEFTVEARWNDGSEFQTRELTVTPGEATELGVDLPVGTEVTFTETGRPDIAGVEWGEITWGTNPANEQWLITADGSATGIVSDDPTEGRLITLTNEALWLPGSVQFEKHILDEDGESVPATEADLPEGAEFEVRIDDIQPALPEGTDFPAVGETVTLNEGNDYTWTSEQVLPRDTVVTFSEVDPTPLPGMDWGQPYYWVEVDAGEAGNRDTVQIEADGTAEVHVQNRPIPTTEVDVDKIVTGPKGDEIEQDDSTLFQVTASWTDVDGEDRHCVLDVVPGEAAVPTERCDATVIDGQVQFPTNTEITFVETGATTDVTNAKWGDVIWSVDRGDATVAELEGEETGATVVLTGDPNDPVTLGLENETSSNGLILIPIPLPPFDGPSDPPTPGDPGRPGEPGEPGDPSDPERPGEPGEPGEPGAPGEPGQPGDPNTPSAPTQPGKPGHPGKPDPSVKSPSAPGPTAPGSGGGLANTGADVWWLAGGGLLLLLGGGWLLLRGRKNES